jgi:hypothetical protein
MQMQPVPTGQPVPQQVNQYRQLAALLDQGNLPLFKLASCTSQVRVDPQASMMPGLEMFYRAMSEMVYSRYGLKGTVQRALMGEEPRAINDSLVLCAMNVNRMAEQAGVLLNLMKQGALPEVLPFIQMMEQLYQAERANFQQVMAQIRSIMGEDAPAAERRVMRALSAIPVAGERDSR